MSAISLDPPILAWLDRALRGESVIAAARLGGGYINKNTVITTAGAKYVLRRYGRGAESARICAVEAALADRLSGTAVPIAEVIAADPAGTEAGEPLLLARHIDGVTLGAAIASAIDVAIGIPGAVTRLPVTPQRMREILRRAR